MTYEGFVVYWKDGKEHKIVLQDQYSMILMLTQIHKITNMEEINIVAVWKKRYTVQP